MKRLLVPFVTFSLISASALAAPPYTVGTAVLDARSGPVGTVAATEGDTVVVVRTDKYDVRLPVTSFKAQNGKLYIALTQAELNAKHEADQAAIAASLLPGRPVQGLGGTVLGTIESFDSTGVVIKLANGKVIKIPSNGIAGRAVGPAVAGVTAEQLEAQLKAAGS